jgi:hypothetical protein
MKNVKKYVFDTFIMVFHVDGLPNVLAVNAGYLRQE